MLADQAMAASGFKSPTNAPANAVLQDAVIGGELVDTDRHYSLLMEMIAMLDNQPLFAALDVSLEKTTVCVMWLDDAITKEAIVATDPEGVATCLSDDLDCLERVGLEAGPMSEWLVRGLADLGVSVVLMETRQVRAALSAMIVKTDRKDARGMAHLLRTGWFRPVHVETVDAREQRAMLSARTTLAAPLKDIENSVRGLLRGFNLRLPKALRGRWDAGVREAVAGHPILAGNPGTAARGPRGLTRATYPARQAGAGCRPKPIGSVAG